MSNDDLNRLLEAEKEAQRTIALWKERSERAVRDAKEDVQRARDTSLRAFRERSELELDETRKAATIEAEKIKKEGIELATGLKDKARTRIPKAVDKAIDVLFIR
jgi:vacuolar-type H+-ATPase subunit H